MSDRGRHLTQTPSLFAEGVPGGALGARRSALGPEGTEQEPSSLPLGTGHRAPGTFPTGHLPTGHLFTPLPAGPFSVILADPPWRFRNWNMREQAKLGEKWGRKNGRPVYDTLNTEEICALPVADIADRNSVLFLWATYPKLPDALRVVEAWGYTYKTVAFTWAKQNPSGMGWIMGLGYWTRGNAEICLLATRGKPRRASKRVRNLVIAPRREHSRKPDEVYLGIEQLMGDVSRVELFARHPRKGWTHWGDQSKHTP